jgi:hypothetical protein
MEHTHNHFLEFCGLLLLIIVTAFVVFIKYVSALDDIWVESNRRLEKIAL